MWKIKHSLIYIFIFYFFVILNLYLIKAFSHNICIIYLLLITPFNLYNIITSILYSFSILLIRNDFTDKHNKVEFAIMIIQMWVPVEGMNLKVIIPGLESSSNNDTRVLISRKEGNASLDASNISRLSASVNVRTSGKCYLAEAW